MASCDVYFTNDPANTQAGDTLEIVYNWWEVPGNEQRRSAYLFLYEPNNGMYVWSKIIKNTPFGSETYLHPNIIEGSYRALMYIYTGSTVPSCEEFFEVTSATAICTDYTTQTTCESNGCYWYNNSCHTNPSPNCIVTPPSSPRDIGSFTVHWQWGNAIPNSDGHTVRRQLIDPDVILRYDSPYTATSGSEYMGFTSDKAGIWILRLYVYSGTGANDYILCEETFTVESPSCSDFTSQNECESNGCYWYNGSCNEYPPECYNLMNEADCTANGCQWFNNYCYPPCSQVISQGECEYQGCYWYDGSCHSTPQANDLCAWLFDHWMTLPPNIYISDVFSIIDSYLFNIPPSGYDFIPDINQVFGVIDYYMGFDGDSKTGCDMI